MSECGIFDPIVSAIDTDEIFQKETKFLVATIGLDFEAFGSAEEFFDAHPEDFYGCVVLSLRIPGSSGLEIQTRLRNEGFKIPILFASAYGDVWSAVQAMKGGALDFLEKPIHPQQFLSVIQEAVAQSRKIWRDRTKIERLAHATSRITDRELEVLERMARKETNKRIASELGISVKTIEYHKSNIYRKMSNDGILNLTENPEVLREIRHFRKLFNLKDDLGNTGGTP